MQRVVITDSSILAFANAVVLIVPLFLIAILVDSSKYASRIGPVKPDKPSDKSSIRQSRRTLLAIGIGVGVEIYSLQAVLTTPNSDILTVTPINRVYLFFSGAGILVLFYILFIPHIELHTSSIRKDPGTVRWTLIVGWLVDVFLIVYAGVAVFIGGAEANKVTGYVYFGLSLIFTGTMLTLTIATILRHRRRRHSGIDQ
jgi:hypothetical protein